MKKFLSVFMVSVCALFCGIFLSACGKSEITIGINFDGSTLAEARVLENGTEIEKQEDGTFVVQRGANVTINFYATERGVDISDVRLTENGQTANLVTMGTDYRPLASAQTGTQDGLLFGKRLFPEIAGDLNITLSGLKKYFTTFSFQANGLDNPENVEKLKTATVDMGSGALSLYDDILTAQTTQTFSKEFQENNQGLGFDSFRVRFEGGNPFEITNSNFPFKVQKAGESTPLTTTFTHIVGSDWFVVNMSQVEIAQNYVIYVDFENLQYQKFSFVKPEENLIYDIDIQTADNSGQVDFLHGGDVLVTKHMKERVNFDNMTVCLKGDSDEFVLEKIDEVEDVCTYAIPTKITPGFGSSYQIVIGGLQFENAFKISAESTDSDVNAFGSMIQDKIYADMGNGTQKIVAKDGDDQITFEGIDNVVMWTYAYQTIGEEKIYNSAYQLHDYDVLINGEKLFNVKQELAQKSESTVSISFGDADQYAFTAIKNPQTGEYDQFTLKFQCSQDTQVTFDNFGQRYSSTIKLSKALTDPRISRVEYGVADDVDGIVWAELSSETEVEAMANQIVAFKLYSASTISANNFTIRNTNIVRSTTNQTPSLSGSDENGNYVILSFQVSFLQFSDQQEIVLISAGEIQ